MKEWNDGDGSFLKKKACIFWQIAYFKCLTKADTIHLHIQGIPSMFVYNAICVMSDHLTSKAGTITSGENRFMEWKTVDGSYENTQYAQFDTFFEGIFQKERLLDILKNFICFSNEGVNIFKMLFRSLHLRADLCL